MDLMSVSSSRDAVLYADEAAVSLRTEVLSACCCMTLSSMWIHVSNSAAAALQWHHARFDNSFYSSNPTPAGPLANAQSRMSNKL
jgi:hypothetical protein